MSNNSAIISTERLPPSISELSQTIITPHSLPKPLIAVFLPRLWEMETVGLGMGVHVMCRTAPGVAPGVPHHVTQRGDHRQDVFEKDEGCEFTPRMAGA